MTMKQRAMQNINDFNDITEHLKAIIVIVDRYRGDGLQSALETHLQKLSESVNASYCLKPLNSSISQKTQGIHEGDRETKGTFERKAHG